MAAEAARVLSEWRRAERLLHALPEDAPERTQLDAEVDRLRRLYLALTNGAIPQTAARIAAARAAIEASKSLLDVIDARYVSPASPGADAPV